MQIAGSKCKICDRPIIFSSDGKFCPRCEATVHLSCESRDTCNACGEPFQYDRPSKADPLAQAFLPRRLRPAGTGAGFLAISAVLLLAVAYAVWMLITHGHGF
jgi:hypothetical protein